MPSATSSIEEFVERYEQARRRGPVSLETFLPPPSHPQFRTILVELIRVEMELDWREGTKRGLLEYQNRFPDLFRDPVCRRDLAYEEYRLRRLFGEKPRRLEYAERFQIDVSDWPDPENLLGQPGKSATANTPTRLCSNLSAEVIVDNELPFPEVGTTYLDFELVRELGRGAFGRVYLARQQSLAHRWVAVKVTADATVEAQALARLQHTNIMPIYSVHRSAPFSVVCMPYFPAITLDQLNEHLSRRRTLDDTALGMFETIRDQARPAEGVTRTQEAPPAEIPPHWAPFRDRSSIEACVWIGARLADGLAHAHERGIVHRDLKPANILITDEGQPLVLDFNLAGIREPLSEQKLFFGGTLPYMAPELLQAYLERRPLAHPRGDVYALGVILYEMVTRRPPFPVPSGSVRSVVELMLADRVGPPPSPRAINPDVSPGFDAIIRKCLQPNPIQRYPTARELHDDLQREFEHRSLRHAAEPWWNRVAKAIRRHRSQWSVTRVGLFSLGLLLVVGSIGAVGWGRARQLEAREKFHAFREEVNKILVDRRRASSDLIVSTLQARYGAADRADWHELPDVARLPPEQQAELRNLIGDLWFLAAQQRSQQVQAGESPAQALADALRFNDRAAGDYPPGQVPRAVWYQRADLRRQLASGLLSQGFWTTWWREPPAFVNAMRLLQQAAREEEHARSQPLRSARDFFLETRFEVPPEDPVALLEEAQQRLDADPERWLYLGIAFREAGRLDRALECLNTSLALKPGRAAALAARGETRLAMGDDRRALQDLDQVIELEPSWPHARTNRALARQRLGDLDGAMADLQAALESRPGDLELRERLAQLYAKRGDREAAKKCRQQILNSTPTDADGYLVRALLQDQPEARLADIDAALAIQPNHLLALRNKAETLSEYLNRPHDAMAVLDETIRRHPRSAEAWGGRAILYARLGKHDLARQDAEKALQIQRSPIIVYQAAGTFAWCGDVQRALDLLREAFRRDPQLLRLVATDPDLDSLRRRDDFLSLLRAASIIFK